MGSKKSEPISCIFLIKYCKKKNFFSKFAIEKTIF